MSRCEIEPESGHVLLQALDVVVGVPRAAGPTWSGFPSAEAPADVVIDEPDPALLSSAVTQAVVERTGMLTVHAAVVHSPGGAVVFPGPSGLGKSTLALALVRAGFGLMSDEMAAFDRTSARLSSFPRPITVDADSPGAAGLTLRATTAEIAIDPRRLGPSGPRESAVSAIVLPDRRPGAVAKLDGASASEAVGALITHAFNHFRAKTSSLDVIARVVRGASVYRLTYGEAADAARLLAAEFEVGRPPK